MAATRRTALLLFGIVPAVMLVMTDDVDAEIANLPMANGKSFATLEAYLDHRRQLGSMDLPWYRLEADGRYRLVTGRGGRFSEPQYFSRDDLVRQFGFAE